MPATKHLIFGAGLIGSYLAGCFIKRGENVSLVKRKNAQTAFQDGFKLSDYENNHYQSSQSPEFIDTQDEILFDIIWLTVKCNSVSHVIDDLRPFVSKSTTIICCQNGFGSDHIVTNAFPNNQVLCAVVGFNVACTGNGHWHRSTQGDLVIEESIKECADCVRLNKLDKQLASKFLSIRLSSQIQAERWAKLQLNLANAVNALAAIPIKEMLESRGYRLIIAQSMTELFKVTDAQQLKLPKVSAVPGKTIPMLMRLPDFIFKRVAQKMLAIDPLARASMWHDLNQNKLTEVDYINGAVSANAKQHNIETPINDALIRLIKAVESGDESIGFSVSDLQKKLGI